MMNTIKSNSFCAYIGFETSDPGTYPVFSEPLCADRDQYSKMDFLLGWIRYRILLVQRLAGEH